MTIMASGRQLKSILQERMYEHESRPGYIKIFGIAGSGFSPVSKGYGGPAQKNLKIGHPETQFPTPEETNLEESWANNVLISFRLIIRA